MFSNDDLMVPVINHPFSRFFRTSIAGWPLVGNEGINLYISILYPTLFPLQNQVG